MAAQPIAAPLSSDEFLYVYSREEDGLRQFELFDGEVVPRPMPNKKHDWLKNLISKRLDRHFETRPGYVSLVEITFKLGPGISFTPDIAVMRPERLEEPGTFVTGSPDIALEVISSDSAARLQFKIDAYLEHGSRAVCCIYPDRRRISVYSPGQWIEFREADSLDFPQVLPGFTLPLKEIFLSK